METDLALDEDDYLLLLWFFNLPAPLLRRKDLGGDVMGHIVRPGGPFAGPWRISYRFRYYRDAKNWNSRDRKKWYGFESKHKTESEVEAAVMRVMDGMVLGAAGMFHAKIQPEIFYVRGTGAKLVELMTGGHAPCWLHAPPVRS